LSHPEPSNSQMENMQQGPCQCARLTPTRRGVVLHWFLRSPDRQKMRKEAVTDPQPGGGFCLYTQVFGAAFSAFGVYLDLIRNLLALS
jgi:hypothetical protein